MPSQQLHNNHGLGAGGGDAHQAVAAFHVDFIIREYGDEAGAYQGARARHKFVTAPKFR